MALKILSVFVFRGKDWKAEKLQLNDYWKI